MNEINTFRIIFVLIPFWKSGEGKLVIECDLMMFHLFSNPIKSHLVTFMKKRTQKWMFGLCATRNSLRTQNRIDTISEYRLYTVTPIIPAKTKEMKTKKKKTIE